MNIEIKTFNWLDGLSSGAATFLGAFTGAFIGLVAILLGALYNAHLNRKRDDRLRKEEATAVAIALREELSIIRTALLENAEKWREAPEDHSIGPDLAHLIRVYPSMLPKLGLLNDTAIAPVITAYSLIEQHAEHLMMLGATPQELPSGRRMYLLPADQNANAATMNENLAEDIQPAIDLLAEQIGS